MKIDVVIKDVSLNEARDILAKIGGETTVKAHADPIAYAKPELPQATPPMPPLAAPAAPATANAVTYDSEHLPWDGRIHSSNRKLTAKGTWTRRKNVDDAVFNQIVAELRGQGNNGASNNIPPAPMTPAAPAYPQAAPAMDEGAPAFLRNMPPQPGYPAPDAPAHPAYAPQPMPQAAPAQPVQPAQPMPAPSGTQTINDLFTKVQQLFATGAADLNYVNSLVSRLSQRFGVQVGSINDIANRPDMIADTFALIAADGK